MSALQDRKLAMGSRLLQRAAVSTLFALRWREVRFTMIFRWAILLGYSASLHPYTVALTSLCSLAASLCVLDTPLSAFTAADGRLIEYVSL